MSRNCRKCRVEFDITDPERRFLERLGYDFPMPKDCVDCRVKLRTCHRNEQNIYRTKSGVDGRPILSIYKPGGPYKVFEHDYWFSDQWDPMEYGRDFDFSMNFFKQFHEFSKDVPRANMMTMNNDNSDYTTGTGFCKNCYLINSSEHCEDCMYGKLLQTCKDCVDCAYIYDSELLYECFNVRDCYQCRYVYNSQNSSDCRFCDNVSNCRNCFLCTGLNGKEFYYKNEKMSREDWQEKVAEYKGYSGLKRAIAEFDVMRKDRVYKFAEIVNCENCSGDFIKNSRNCINCYDINDSEDCMNVHVGVKCKDVVDCSNMYEKPELSYQVLGVIETFNVHFSLYMFNCSDSFYCDTCYHSKNLFGCIGLRNKEYCIFNKQYSKEEYEVVKAKIVEHMKESGEWGEFFPAVLSPFGYNETLAHTYYPMRVDEAAKEGFYWSEYEAEFPKVARMVKAVDIPDTLDKVNDAILEWGIECEVSGKPFKLTYAEWKFYKKWDIPIPRRHPEIRHEDRMKIRNDRHLHLRKCDKCQTEVESTYPQVDERKVYCERCYLEAVY